MSDLRMHVLWSQEMARTEQAVKDIQTGFAGIHQAARDPSLMADLLDSMRDPEIMREVNGTAHTVIMVVPASWKLSVPLHSHQSPLPFAAPRPKR